MQCAQVESNPAGLVQPKKAVAEHDVGVLGYPMTIRLRLTLWYTALLGTTLIFFSVIVYSALSTNLWLQVEQDAARQANEVASALVQQLQFDILIIRNNPTRIQFPDVDLFASASGVQIVDLDGMILRRSSNLGPMTAPYYKSALNSIRNGQEHQYYTTDQNGTRMLVYSVPLALDDEVVGALQVIKPVMAVENALNQVSRYLIFGTALSLLLAAIVGAFLARRALSPIDTISNTASGITRTQDLGKRLSIAEDNSEVGRLAATFNAMLDQIQQLFNAQEQLIADVSHELRTPLTTIQGNVDLLRRMTVAAHQGSPDGIDHAILHEVLSEVENDTLRMSRMISDILLLAQADSGAAQLQQQSVEMDTLLLDVYRLALRMAERQKGHQGLQIRIGNEDQVQVWGDPERLRQLMLNLVENAVKYTPEQGTITIGIVREDEWVKFYVQDTGIGISEENQSLIFRRFYRTDKARSRDLGGSGLGLSIVKWIAEAHNGCVSVVSEMGKGSTFTVWLPSHHTQAMSDTIASIERTTGYTDIANA